MNDSERDQKRLREENDQLRAERNDLLKYKKMSKNSGEDDEEMEKLRKKVLKLEYDIKYKNELLENYQNNQN